MADYHPLIARAVEGLANNTAEARRTLYERARAALVAQLRGIDPPLSEAEITRERLALEDAIRKVEAEAVRKARSEPRPAAPRSIHATNRPYGGAAVRQPSSRGTRSGGTRSSGRTSSGSRSGGSRMAGWRTRWSAPSTTIPPSGAETRFAETAQKEAPSTVRVNESVSSEAPLAEVTGERTQSAA